MADTTIFFNRNCKTNSHTRQKTLWNSLEFFSLSLLSLFEGEKRANLFVCNLEIIYFSSSTLIRSSIHIVCVLPRYLACDTAKF